jgi:UDP-N-acetylglucosamine 4,6-dehydratase
MGNIGYCYASLRLNGIIELTGEQVFKEKVLLITGGTGSFGNAVVKRFLTSDVSEIRIFSRDEKKQEDMRIALNSDKLKFYIGDVRDYSSVYDSLRGVDYVFHAAALKQVPSCEFYPMEAVKTNVLGADNVMQAAIAQNVGRVVLLSTDKAVYPINAMGMSKAMMEKVMVAKSRLCSPEQTILSATRYGNVMASRGSVIPLFLEQIQNGKALTLTDPSMTRFLMTLKESVDLVLFAFKHARPGDIFVQKSPASTLGTLAEAMRQLLRKDTPINIIGTRHGEKLYESLVSREEMARASDMGSYFRIPADSRDLNYARYFVKGETAISKTDDYTSHNTQRLAVNEVKSILMKLDIVQEAVGA